MNQFHREAISLRALRAIARDRVRRQQPSEISVIMSPQGSLLDSELLEIPNSVSLSIEIEPSRNHVALSSISGPIPALLDQGIPSSDVTTIPDLVFLRSEMNRKEALVRRANSQRQRMIRNRNAALAICATRNRIRIEQQSRSERNRLVALNIRRQRLADEQRARSLLNRNIALASLALRENIVPLPQSPGRISETDEEDINV